MSAYYLKGVQTKNVELLEIFSGIMPFLLIVIFAMFLMYMFPGIALWLPDLLFANKVLIMSKIFSMTAIELAEK
jgi:TRAP-type mannitol/chloroaromatic compound transport system, large permease component